MYLPLGKFIQRYITTGNKITNISKLLNPATNDGLENLGKKGYDDLQDIVQNKLIQVTTENRSSLFNIKGTGGEHSGFVVPEKNADDIAKQIKKSPTYLK